MEVRNGRISVESPAKGSGVSLSPEVVDERGNASSLTIRDAWYGRWLRSRDHPGPAPPTRSAPGRGVSGGE